MSENEKVEKKLKHLEFIQNVIVRMASNSFMLKGWCIAIIAALIALSIKESDFRLYLATIIPTVMFWVLDSYYLWQEKLFRHLYDEVRLLEENDINFSLNASKYKKKGEFIQIIVSNGTTTGFYGVIIILLLVVCLIA